MSSPCRTVALFESLETRELLAITVISAVADQVLAVNAASQVFDMATIFNDAAIPANHTLVRYQTPLGFYDLELYDDTKPITVTNFLRYVNNGLYENTWLHRSEPGFVIQGGGYPWTPKTGYAHIPTYDPIENEPGISNLTGTIAMAKVDGDEDSATSEWFINLADNTGLDSTNGGFTVFGKVIGDGMNTIVSAIASLRTYNAGGAFGHLPLINYMPGEMIAKTNVVMLDPAVLSRWPTATTTQSYFTVAAGTDNPALVNVTVKGSQVTLTYAKNKSGTANITFRVTDSAGNYLDETFIVTVGENKFGAVNGVSNVQYVAYDLDGTPLTMSLKGAGTGQVTSDADGLTVDFANTNATSALTFTTPKTAMAGNADYPWFDIYQINAPGDMKSIVGAGVDITDGVSVGGSLGLLTLHSATGTIDIGDPNAAAKLTGLTANLGSASDLVFASGTGLKALTVGRWTAGTAAPDTLSAPWLTKLTTTQAGYTFAASVTLTGDGINPAKPKPVLGSAYIAGNLANVTWDFQGQFGSAGNITVTGTVTNSTVRALHNIGLVTIGKADGFNLLAGLKAGQLVPPDGLDDYADALAAIKGVTITGFVNTPLADFFKNSHIAGGKLGKLTLVNVSAAAGQGSSVVAPDAANGGAISSIKVYDTRNGQSWSYPPAIVVPGLTVTRLS